MKDKNKIENDMYLKDQMTPNPPTLKPLPNRNDEENTDSKDDAVLKQVREFLYQNMVRFIYILLILVFLNLGDIVLYTLSQLLQHYRTLKQKW